MNKNKIKNLELWGIIFMLSSSTFLNCCCSLFRGHVLTILAGSVNSSIWENIKCCILPYLVWGCIEFCLTRIPLKTLVISKVSGAYSIIITAYISLITLSLINGCTCALSGTAAALTYCIISHLVSYKILMSETKNKILLRISIILFIILSAMYLTFTIYPPHTLIFKDFKTHTYGIPIKPLNLYQESFMI